MGHEHVVDRSCACGAQSLLFSAVRCAREARRALQLRESRAYSVASGRAERSHGAASARLLRCLPLIGRELLFQRLDRSLVARQLLQVRGSTRSNAAP